jgi:ABC-type uncharacterized transport system substrate-binding protein
MVIIVLAFIAGFSSAVARSADRHLASRARVATPHIADLDLLGRRDAAIIGRIFKGAKPSDMPVERPTRYKLVINFKMAKALGLAIPPNVLTRADRLFR